MLIAGHIIQDTALGSVRLVLAHDASHPCKLHASVAYVVLDPDVPE